MNYDLEISTIESMNAADRASVQVVWSPSSNFTELGKIRQNQIDENCWWTKTF
jgi:hypothetical protein